MTTSRTPKWALPALSLALGLAALAAFWAGGNPGSGLVGLGVMTVFGAAVAGLGRFDLVRGLRGDGRDEYWLRIDVYATALAGLVLICLVIALCMWEWAHGRSGSPYAELGAAGGVSYAVAVGVLRVRS